MEDAVQPEVDPEKRDIRPVRVGLPGGTVHEFELDVAEPVSSVVSRVLDVEKLDPSAVRVRIISSGKLVRDHAIPLADVLNEGSFLHAAVSERPPRQAERDDGQSADAVEQVREGAGGRDGGDASLMLSAVDVNGEVRIIIPNLTPRGFERLSLAGFSEDEIRMIQRQFRLMRREARARSESVEDEDEWFREVTEGEVQPENGNEEEGARLRIRRPDHRNVLSSGAEGTNGDFLMGCIFGYLLGIIVLILLLDNNATRRWRVGIVAGVATNCAFGILRTSLSLRGSLAAAP